MRLMTVTTQPSVVSKVRLHLSTLSVKGSLCTWHNTAQQGSIQWVSTGHPLPRNRRTKQQAPQHTVGGELDLPCHSRAKHSKGNYNGSAQRALCRVISTPNKQGGEVDLCKQGTAQPGAGRFD
jgi:hypothetical protein